jgi:hypothetical protein
MKTARLLLLIELFTVGCAANTCPLAHQAGLACHANTWKVDGVPNLGRVVWPGRAPIYRGGQFEGAAQTRVLLALEVTDILKLNGEDEGSDLMAEEAGICVHRVPIPPSTKAWLSVFEEPRPEALAELRAHVEQMREPGRTWYIHCKNGHDRTGLAVMLVRVLLDGWQPLQAYEEARQWGYHHQIPGLDRTRRRVLDE